MANLEDTLLAMGQTPDPMYECSSCGKLKPPFVLDEDYVCTQCHVNVTRENYIPSLEDMKTAKKSIITQWRNEQDNGGAPTPFGVVDSDQISISKIMGVVQMAQIALAAGEPFSILWTMKDNSSAEHNAEEMIAMGVAVGQFIATNHATSIALKALVDAAENESDLEAIVWPNGEANA